MTRFKSAVAFEVLLLTLSLPVAVRAADEGQDDLDKATELQLTARTLSDLESVAELCESALKKGLDADNEKFARQLLTSTLFQHATRLSAAIFERAPDPRWQVVRQFALKDLKRILELDDQFADAHLLVCRLQALPGGDREQAAKSAGEAVRLLANDKEKLSQALVFRGELQTDPEKQLADFDQAIQVDPGNSAAWQARSQYYLRRGDFDKATQDLTKLVEKDEENVIARLALAEALANLRKLDEALEQVDAAIRLRPDLSTCYTLRAQIHAFKNDSEAVKSDLDQALKIEPRDQAARLARARLRLAEGEIGLAHADVDVALQVQPGLIGAILLRSMIHETEGKMTEAIADMQTLLENDPKNVPWRLQLALYFSRDRRPRKAIEVFTEVLKEDPGNAPVLHLRADMYLSIGKHKEAIADFEAALKPLSDNSSLLNNYAWVLATTPDDELRAPQRAIELATKACELTDYKQAHILSTLAAGYAEMGDWETATKWSSKAVEQGKMDLEGDLDEAERKRLEEQLDHLTKELESYQQKKPWRERQQTEENAEPLQPRRSAVDT